MKNVPIVAAAFVLIAALLDLRIGLRGELPPISEADMKAAVEKLQAMKKPGDLIVHSPLFTGAELKALGSLKAGPDLPKPALLNSRRVLLLDRAEQPMYGFPAPKERQELGAGLSLSLFEPSGEIQVPLFDLYEQISSSTMQVHRGAKKTLCTRARPEGGYRCQGEPEWLYAAQRTLKINGQQSTCVWAHPTTGGTILLQVPPQPTPPAGRKLSLVVSSGLNDEATRSPTGAPIYTDIEQGGRSLGRVHLPNKKGWYKKQVDLQPGVPTWLKITTPHDGVRHHCINAQVTEVKQ